MIPPTPDVYLALFADDSCLYARQNPRRAMFLESCSAVLMPSRRGVSAGTYKSMKTKLRQSTSLIDVDRLNGRNIPFVNNVKYLGVIFDKKITLKLHTDMIEPKAFRTFTRAYCLLKNELLSASIKLTLHKALIRSVMTYVFPAWDFAADTPLMKLQRLPNRVLRTTGNFPSRTQVRGLHKAFSIPYIYDYTMVSQKVPGIPLQTENER
jgi:hypothetical protein